MNGTLVLGCRGKDKNGVCICSGTATDLLRIDDFQDNYLNQVLEKIYQLDVQPIVDQNAVVNLIQFLGTAYLKNEFYETLHEWIHRHKGCGIYIYRRKE